MSACKGMNCGCTDGVSHSVECRAEYARILARLPVTACTCQGPYDLVELFERDGTPRKSINGVIVCPACGENPFGLSVTNTRAQGGSEC